MVNRDGEGFPRYLKRFNSLADRATDAPSAERLADLFDLLIEALRKPETATPEERLSDNPVGSLEACR